MPPTAIAAKNPDELIEDTRNFVRNSPGIALAGAAVVGFVVARLLKTGLDDRDDDDGASDGLMLKPADEPEAAADAERPSASSSTS